MYFERPIRNGAHQRGRHDQCLNGSLHITIVMRQSVVVVEKPRAHSGCHARNVHVTLPRATTDASTRALRHPQDGVTSQLVQKCRFAFFFHLLLIAAIVVVATNTVPAMHPSAHLRSSGSRALRQLGACSGRAADAFRLLAIIPGFGHPHVREKSIILEHNLQMLERDKGGISIDVRIFQYSLDATLEVAPGSSDLSATAASIRRNVTVVKQPGTVGHFLYQYAKPELIADYEMLVILLDDIELPDDFSLQSVVSRYHSRCACGAGHASPSLSLPPWPDEPAPCILALPITRDSLWSHNLMRWQDTSDGHTGRVTNMAELFFYMMDTRVTAAAYWSLLSPDTAFGWGVDFALHPAGIRTVLDDRYPVKHHYKGEAYQLPGISDPRDELKAFSSHHDMIDSPAERWRF